MNEDEIARKTVELFNRAKGRTGLRFFGSRSLRALYEEFKETLRPYYRVRQAAFKYIEIQKNEGKEPGWVKRMDVAEKELLEAIRGCP